MKKQTPLPVNYFYFGMLFLVMAFFHCYHVQVIENGGLYEKLAFFCYASFQCLFEVMLLAFFAVFFKQRASKLLGVCYIAFTVVLLLFHGLEFLLVRLMDLSLTYGLGLIFQESWANFIQMLHASRISILTWIFALLGAVGLIGGGIYFHTLCNRWSDKRPLRLNFRACVLAFGIIPLFLMHADRGKYPLELYEALPWKHISLWHRSSRVPLGDQLKPFPSEKEVDEKIEKLIPTAYKPNLFVFVIESLRSDFITEEIAPNLSQFRQDYQSPEVGIASGNGTQLSWFSIFYSKFPFYFSETTPDKWKKGSLGLRCLKQLGYQIHLFSSSHLDYYQMDQRIFGAENQLLDSKHSYPSDHHIRSCENDQKAVAKLIEAVSSDPNEGGNCYLIFLDSTHFDYSWPEDHEAKFHPYLSDINHLKMAFSKKSLESLKNRYRNSIHFVDSLFGEFKEAMQKSGKWDEAVIAVTGDHGEEFYEEGHLFHASNLSDMQTHVPLFFKFNDRTQNVCSMASHIDIFPTFLHYLLGDENFPKEIFDGESIFDVEKWPYSITGRYNGSRDPNEFVIYQDKEKLHFRVSNEKEIQILDLETRGSQLFEAFAPALSWIISE
ncbi:MAG: hypothetical protein K1000chlam2_00962 [Chlamydiae bacterium]|nr:hypothetical protein [Chlamydiota bacterium]